MESDSKQYGRTYTPETVSRFLTGWAIEDPHAEVLEPSVGEGRFVFDSYHRLRELGASEQQAAEAINGVDIDSEAISTLQAEAERRFGHTFPNVHVDDLFDRSLPRVDALVGNPPYVIRHRFDNPERITQMYAGVYDFSDQADLYCYFVARASEALKPGGRFAMILSNGWMKKRYGEEFKSFLLQEFKLHALVGFEARVFDDDLVNSICILAEKRPNTIRIPDRDWETRFVQLEDDSKLNEVSTPEELEQGNGTVHTANVPQVSLDPDQYWDIWLRAPEVFQSVAADDQFTTLGEYGTPGIGVQTLAKEFYILTREEADDYGIEEEFLRPLAYSPRNHQTPRLRVNDCQQFLFWCSKSRDELGGTNALEYIEAAENRIVEKRYSDETYEGLHNKDRIENANREPWYDLTEEANRRLPAEILLPRRVYENYTAVWNPDEIVPNENFLAVSVEQSKFVKPLLAYLNSDLGELSLRLCGQVYGGGVCDLNVSSSGDIACPKFETLAESGCQELGSAFDSYVQNEDRGELTGTVYRVLGFGNERRAQISEALEIAIDESLSKS